MKKLGNKTMISLATLLVILLAGIVVKQVQAEDNTTVISTNTSLGQNGSNAYAGIYQYDNLTLEKGVHLTSKGISQLVLVVKGTLTIKEGADIRVRNGCYPEAPLYPISSMSTSNLEAFGTNMGNYILYPYLYGKGGNGGSGGKGGPGSKGDYNGWDGGGGGGGYGGGQGGSGGGAYGQSGGSNGGYGGTTCGANGGSYNVRGGGATDVGQNGISGQYAGNGGIGGGGNGGDGGKGYYRTTYSPNIYIGEGGAGGGGGGYGGGVLTIVADKIVIESSKESFLVSGQQGGASGLNGGTGGANGEGGLLSVYSNSYSYSDKNWTSTDSPHGRYEVRPVYSGGHGALTGGPQAIFINGVKYGTGETIPTVGIGYKVNYNSNGGSVVPNSGILKAGSLLTKPTDPVRADYYFAGWYKDSGLTTLWNFSKDVITSNITLYAKWLHTYTVSFISNGGSPVDDLTNVVSGSTISKPNVTRTGYILAGWFLDSGFNNEWMFQTDLVTSDLVLYAKWESASLLKSSISVSLSPSTFVYDGKAKTPVIKVTDGTVPLIQGTDYSLNYTNNINVGTATVKITGKGKYTGSIQRSFVIKPATLTGVVIKGISVQYDGKSYSLNASVPSGATITYSTDGRTYALTKPYFKAAGSYTVYYKVNKANFTTVTGKVVVKITPVSIAKMTLTLSKTTYIYTGNAIKPSVVLKNGATIITSTNYTVSFKNNLNPGIATVSLTGRGNYSGTISKTFIIKPKAAVISVKSGTKYASVEWKKIPGVQGYEVYMATSSKGTFAKINTAASTKTSYKKTGLTSKKTYYFKVRTFTKVGSTTIYGEYSNTKSVKIK